MFLSRQAGASRQVKLQLDEARAAAAKLPDARTEHGRSEIL